MQDVLLRVRDQGDFGGRFKGTDKELGGNAVGNVGRRSGRGWWPAKRHTEPLKGQSGGPDTDKFPARLAVAGTARATIGAEARP